MINLKIFKAEDGDSLLLRLCGSDTYNILIDLGREVTYENYIKPELEALKLKGEYLNLLIISHVDADHINGALPFIIENGSDSKIIQVKEVWHNTYKHLQFNKEINKEVSNEEKLLLNQIINQNLEVKQNGVSEISVKKGISFGGYLTKFNYNWNSSFNNKAILSTKTFTNPLPDAKIILLTPNRKNLDELSKTWIKTLEKLKYNFTLSMEEIFDDAYEYYMKNLVDSQSTLSEISTSKPNLDIEELAKIEESDNSKTNASSISFILEFKNKKLLFLGDAKEEDIFEELNSLTNKGYILDFELVKISHHGSNKNISNRLLNIIDSKIFVISTNGKKHGHPNYEALSKIIIKSSKYTKKIVFNYPVSQIKYLDDEVLKEKYNFEIEVTNEINIETTND